MSAKKMFLGVVNPVAGGNQGPALWREGFPVMTTFLPDASDYDEHIILTSEDTEAWTSELEEYLSQYDVALLAVVGGDGTNHLVFSTLAKLSKEIRTRTRVFMAPAGRGNDGVRGNYHFVKDSTAFWNWAKDLDWEARPMDLLRVNGKTCYNITSFVYAGAVVEALAERQSLWKKFSAAYVLEGMLQFLKSKPVKLKFGDSTEDVFSAFILNGPCNGKGLFWNPHSSTADGKAEFLRLPPLSPLKFFSALDALKKGKKLPVPHVIDLAGSFEFSFEAPVAFEIDGEFQGHEKAFKVEVMKAACTLLAPKKSH